jgi:hypothetical protein
VPLGNLLATAAEREFDSVYSFCGEYSLGFCGKPFDERLVDDHLAMAALAGAVTNFPSGMGGDDEDAAKPSRADASNLVAQDDLAAEAGPAYVNLASPSRTTHILTGDATGGGHMWPGMAGKSSSRRAGQETTS